MKKINFSFSAKAFLLALAWPCVTLNAQAQITNGGFEAGLTGWTTFGDVSTQGNAPVGNAKLFITNAGLLADELSAAGALIGPFNASGTDAVIAGQAGGLETLGGSAIGAYDAFGLFAVEGALARQTFSAQAGSVLSFTWNFGTRETASGLDHAFVVIDGVVSALNSAVNPTAAGIGNDLFQTGYQSFSSSFTTSGLHTLVFGVVDLTDTAVRSSLSIDRVQISAVPEADVRLMMLAGMGCLVLLIKRRKGC